MAHRGAVRRWDLYRADLEPAVGREQAGVHRPVLVVSNDPFNSTLDIVSIVPLTKIKGKDRRIYPFEVGFPAGVAGNTVDSIAMPYQVRTISKMRLLERMGTLADAKLQREVEDRLLEHLGIEVE